jgi:hypothetical protein
MKTLNIPLEDAEFKRLEKDKERLGLNWREYIIRQLNSKELLD